MNPFYFNDTAAYMIDPSFTKEEVTKLLQLKNVGKAVLETWVEIEHQDFQIEDEDEDLNY